MKTLLEYLSGNVQMKKAKFPEKPKEDDITRFLDEQGFENVTKKFSFFGILEAMKEQAEKSDNPIYVNFDVNVNYPKDAVIILFCKNGKINKDNPLFKLYATKDGKEAPSYTISGSHVQRYYMHFSNDDKEREKLLNTYQDFIKETNKYFDWQ